MFECTMCHEKKPESEFYTRMRKAGIYRFSKCKECYKATVVRPQPKAKTKRIEDRTTIGDLIGKHRGSPMCLPWV